MQVLSALPKSDKHLLDETLSSVEVAYVSPGEEAQGLVLLAEEEGKHFFIAATQSVD